MENKNPNSIKRSEALVKFSKEHHSALLLCWKIKQGIKKNIEPKRMANYVLFFFNNNLKNHFAEEEKILFSKLNNDDILKQQALTEHNNIYGMIENFKTENYSKEDLTTFADYLDNHIRFEERILFNYIQQKLSENELQVVLNSQTPAFTDDVDIKWNDYFWEN